MDGKANVDMNDHLEPSIYKFILRHTLKDQVWLVIITVISMPLVYFALDIPKTIINEALGGRSASFNIAGIDLSQIQYLLALSFGFLLLVVANGAIKYFVNVYRGVLGERMLRRLRYTLYSRILRFPLAHFQKVSSSEIIPIVTAETEPLGGFIGESVGLPVFQGGLLLTYIYFIFIQDIWLGIASISLYPIQLYLIPRLQKEINRLGRQRVQTVRKLADRIGETVNASADIRINDTSYRERADISQRLGVIFDIRNEIFRRKFFIKFLNNFIGQLTPFFFYSVGGYLVIKGELSLGALVAVLAAYKDIGPPWKELLKFYQTAEDVRIKYSQVVQQFELDNMTSPERHLNVPETFPNFNQSMVASELSLDPEYNFSGFTKIDFNIDIPCHTAIIIKDQDAARGLMLLMSTLETAAAGSYDIDRQPTIKIPESVLGRNIGFCNQQTYIFNTSIRNNICYGLMHRQLPDTDDRKLSTPRLKEAIASGNSLEDIDGKWIDIHQAGVTNDAEFQQRILQILRTVEMENETLGFALQSYLSAEYDQDLTHSLVDAREKLQQRLVAANLGAITETFDETAYNQNLTVAENLLFGTPSDSSTTINMLATLPAVQQVLRQTYLEKDFIEIGIKLAELMLELFEGVDEHSDVFENFSFIKASEFDSYRALVRKSRENGINRLGKKEKQHLISLTMQLCPEQHRLNLLEPEVQKKIVGARKQIVGVFGINNNILKFIEKDNYQPGMTVRDNLLFGKIRYSKRHLQPQIDAELKNLITEMGLMNLLLSVGLEFNCGNAGSLLTNGFRSKLAMARAVAKNPDILIVDGALAGLDPESQNRILDAVRAERKDRNLIWTTSTEENLGSFSRVLAMDNRVLREVSS